MRIIHIAPNAIYTEGFGYQENLLPKYEHILGNNVTLVVRNLAYENGELVEVPSGDSVSKDGFRVVRKELVHHTCLRHDDIFSTLDIYDLLIELKPDYIHFHGLVSSTINQVIKYKKKVSPKTVVVIDNHQDYNNGDLHKKGIKRSILRAYYRWLFRRNEQYISAVYGVTPCRRQYAVDIFSVPQEKTKVLIMGADDEKMDFKNRAAIRNIIRSKYRIGSGEFLIVSGGKIDKKKKVVELVEACCPIPNVKVLIFGSLCHDVQGKFSAQLQKYPNLIYTGWASAREQYNFYFTSDLNIFPGSHSVMWEQACASKTPCLFGIRDGMEHLDVGGNCDFLDDATVHGIRKKIKQLLCSDKYAQMKKVASSDMTDVFLYSKIARIALDDARTFHEHIA